jgi:hypothetical protein
LSEQGLSSLRISPQTARLSARLQNQLSNAMPGGIS